jgi:hypothetical protein
VIVLGVPVLNGHETTKEFVSHLAETIIDPTSFLLVIIDNGSDPVYRREDFPVHFPLEIWRYETNQGYYLPLRDLIKYPNATDPAIYALAHNDCFMYEHGWDRRLREAYVNDPLLGIVGFCGSDEVDRLGGRGGGTMCLFRGEKGQNQSAGKRVTGIHPAVVLDSLFMAFRREVAEILVAQEDPTPAHFYDKIWPMRSIEAGWRVAVMGSEVDHLGGTTLVAEPAYTRDMERWCRESGIDPGENPGMAVYLEAERRWLTEYRESKRIIPGRVGTDYVYRRD